MDIIADFKIEEQKELKVNFSVPVVETNNHEVLFNRDKADQHPISAITGLQDALDTKQDSADLKSVATTGSYNDLTDKPTIPTVNNSTITITQGGTTKGSFTLNQAQDSTIELDAGGGGGGGYHTTQLSDNTDLDTVITEGNYFIKSPTSTKGMPELPTSVSYKNDEYSVIYWLCLLLVEKEFGYGTNFIRQTITLTPFCAPSGSISGDTLIFTRTLINDFYQIDSKWTKIDGDITNLNISIYPPQTSYTLNNLRANYCYKCGFSNYYDDFNVALTSLTLTNIQNTADEIRVMFKVGNNFTLTATQLTFLNYSNIVWETNKIYIITIKNLYATIDVVGDNSNLMNLLQNKENISNKVTSISESSTDTEYPTAKCVYDLVGDIESILTRLTTGGGVQ